MILKKIILVMISFVMLFTTGCGLIEETKDMIFGEDRTLKEVFYEAAFYGNIEFLQELIDSGKIKEKWIKESTNKTDEPDVMKFLLENGADPNYRNLLAYYAYNECTAQMEVLLSCDDIDVNADYKDTGKPALYMAMQNMRAGSENAAYRNSKLLLEHGAKIRADFFENEYSYSTYSQCKRSPMTTQMLIKKFIKDGGKLTIPVSVQHAFMGDISACLEDLKKDMSDLSIIDKEIIRYYAVYFGTVELYEDIDKLIPYDEKQTLIGEYPPLANLAATGNIEMLEYVLKERGKLLNSIKQKMRLYTIVKLQNVCHMLYGLVIWIWLNI